MDSEYKEGEWADPPQGTRWPKQKRREKLKHICETIGLFNVHKGDLAKEMGISRKHLYRDLDALYAEGLDPRSVKHALVDFAGVNKTLLKQLVSELIRSKTPTGKAALANAIVNVQTAQTELLERYGVKDINAPVTDSIITLKFGKKPEEKDAKKVQGNV